VPSQEHERAPVGVGEQFGTTVGSATVTSLATAAKSASAS
jgi:hypothetical protein